MPDLGFRKNVMGPQPIAERAPTPPEMLEAANQFLDALARGEVEELNALTVENSRDEVNRLAEAARQTGIYDKKRIIALARINRHYWIKGELTGAETKRFIVQFRLGEHGGRWKVWEVINLTNARSAWTR